jgi:hypothetical protein
VFFRSEKKWVVFDPILGRNFATIFRLASQVKNIPAGKKKNGQVFPGRTHGKFERSDSPRRSSENEGGERSVKFV